MKNTKVLFVLFSLWLIHWVVACGQGVESASPSQNEEVQGSWTINKNALNGIVCAPDLDILDVPGQASLGQIMFVTLFAPAAVLAVDLDASPLAAFSPSVYAGLPSAALDGMGYPANLLVSDLNHAFLLTSSRTTTSVSTHLIYFNPQTGAVYQNLDLNTPLTLNSDLAQINGRGESISPVAAGSFTPIIPQNLARIGNRLAISFSNYEYTTTPSRWSQGIIRYYDIGETSITPTSIYTASQCGASAGYNTSGLTALSNGKLLATCSGATQITGEGSVPVTHGGVDLIDPTTGNIEGSLSLGATAPAFRAWAVTSDGKAFLGSSTGGYLLQLSLTPFRVVRGPSNPITVTNASNGTDFIDDVVLSEDEKTLFVASYNTSSVHAFNIAGADPVKLGQIADLSSSSPGTEGAGPLAIRPGTPDITYTGPDLFSIRCNGNSLAAIKTY